MNDALVFSENPVSDRHPERVVYGVSPEPIARNEMEGGYTERHIKVQIYFTEPQGTLKILATSSSKSAVSPLSLLFSHSSTLQSLCGTQS